MAVCAHERLRVSAFDVFGYTRGGARRTPPHRGVRVTLRPVIESSFSRQSRKSRGGNCPPPLKKIRGYATSRNATSTRVAGGGGPPLSPPSITRCRASAANSSHREWSHHGVHEDVHEPTTPERGSHRARLSGMANQSSIAAISVFCSPNARVEMLTRRARLFRRS